MTHWSLPRPVVSTQIMIRVAEQHAVPFERCVENTGLTHAQMTDPLTPIEGRQELAVLRNILRVIDPEVPFALEAGLRYHVTTHGMWGFALVSSTNVRSAVDLAVRYFDLTYSFNRLRWELDEVYGRSFYDSSDNPEDLQAALVERDLGALLTLERESLGRTIPIHSLQLRSPAPPYASVFKSMFGVTPRFNAAVNCVTIAAKYLDDSGPLADEVGVRVSEQQCRALLERQQAVSGVAGVVRRHIMRNPKRVPPMQEVAADLGVSTRTLRNQLSREATSYRKLIDDFRLTLADELLSTAGLTVSAVADRLGYADASSFSAAFKRWKGLAPRRYRSSSRQ